VLCYPRKIRIVGAIMSAVLVVMVIIGWISMPANLRQTFTPFQVITLLAVLFVIIGLIAAIALSVVRADEHGIWVRNGLRTHRLGWHQVHRVLYRDGDPWPALLINAADDPDRLMLMGIQRNDHQRADRAVADLRRLHAAYRSDNTAP
jgi:hypothetical protein